MDKKFFGYDNSLKDMFLKTKKCLDNINVLQEEVFEISYVKASDFRENIIKLI